MLKYHSTYIGFREIPDEISLCINITNCPNNCKSCHSPWLLENIGTKLTKTELLKLISNAKGITCVCFMGGDAEPSKIAELGEEVVKMGLKSAWYSGKQMLPKYTNILSHFNYIKLGPYDEEKGPLDNHNTNQRLYEVFNLENYGWALSDITNKFWNDNRN